MVIYYGHLTGAVVIAATATTVTADQRVRRQYESLVYPPVPREFMEPSQPPSQSSQSSPLAHRSYSILPRAKLLAAVRSMAAKETLPGLSAYDHYIHDGDLDRRWHYSPSTRPAPRRRILRRETIVRVDKLEHRERRRHRSNDNALSVLIGFWYELSWKTQTT